MTSQYEVFMVCPNTEKLVSTGYVLTKPEFAKDERPFGPLNCTACGGIHMWSYDKVMILSMYK